MANILLLDPNETPRLALQGILARGSHRLAQVATAQEAWDFIRRAVRVDLVVVELALKGDGGMKFIDRLKSDYLLKLLPVVIYTAHADRDLVRRGLELRVQNFLIKPYHDELIYAEIAKALANPWRNRHFEEEKSFCKMMSLTPQQLHELLESLRNALELAQVPLAKAAELRAQRLAGETLRPLREQAETAGAWGAVASLTELDESSCAGNWSAFKGQAETLEVASRLIFQHLNPTLVPVEFLSGPEQETEAEARERARWFQAAAEQHCPVTDWPRIQGELDALSGFPVIDSVAASFRMAATGHPSSLNPLMDLVEKDPGLAAQLLSLVNQKKDPNDIDAEPIEDPRDSIGLLGELHLATQAKGLLTTAERLMTFPPAFSWRQFWMFQIGTARLARYVCEALEMPSLAVPAYTAGLLHDLGKLLLLHLHPFGLQATIEHARHHGLPLAEVERLFLGCTTQEMAVHFATRQGLPRRFIHVLRWINSPLEATEDRELVAVVSLARDLCRHNHVGVSGDHPLTAQMPLEETAEWAVLSERIFPSFNLRNFERQVHGECRELKLELHGRLSPYGFGRGGQPGRSAGQDDVPLAAVRLPSTAV